MVRVNSGRGFYALLATVEVGAIETKIPAPVERLKTGQKTVQL
jgi:hypothetical protein